MGVVDDVTSYVKSFVPKPVLEFFGAGGSTPGAGGGDTGGGMMDKIKGLFNDIKQIDFKNLFSGGAGMGALVGAGIGFLGLLLGGGELGIFSLLMIAAVAAIGAFAGKAISENASASPGATPDGAKDDKKGPEIGQQKQPDAPAPTTPQKTAEQIQAENQKILDDALKAKQTTEQSKEVLQGALSGNGTLPPAPPSPFLGGSTVSNDTLGQVVAPPRFPAPLSSDVPGMPDRG